MAAGIIVKLVDPRDKREWYMEWSTVVDAPSTVGMTYDEFLGYYAEEYGAHGMARLYDRMKRVAIRGCSSFDTSPKELVQCNRAGENENTLTLEQIIDKYCQR